MAAERTGRTVSVEEVRLQQVVDAYDRAAQKFIDKVESGKARSVETYADLKKCLNREIE